MAATAIELAASAARTASGNGSAVDVTNAGATLRLDFVCSDLIGHQLDGALQSGGLLDISIETGATASGPWFRLQPSFDSVRTVRSQRQVFTGCDKFVRVAWTIRNGADGFTFEVSGDAI